MYNSFCFCNQTRLVSFERTEFYREYFLKQFRKTNISSSFLSVFLQPIFCLVCHSLLRLSLLLRNLKGTSLFDSAPIRQYERMYKESNNFLGWPLSRAILQGRGHGMVGTRSCWGHFMGSGTDQTHESILGIFRMLSRAVLLSPTFSLRLAVLFSSFGTVQGYKIHPRLAE